jgi:hypothetical protein
MSRELPPNLVKRSLDEMVKFGQALLPLLRVAVETASNEVRTVPPGGERHQKAELQLLPSLIRLRLHQLIQGHNSRVHSSGEHPLNASRIRNGAVCLMAQGREFRVLKENKQFPTKPSGKFQERLINQDQYFSRREQSRFFEDDFPDADPLNGLVYYHLKQYELVGMYVVIPNGFSEDGVNVVGRIDIDISGSDLDQVATFQGGLRSESVGDAIVVMVGDAAADEDPFSDSDVDATEIASEFPEGIVLEIENKESQE